MYVIDKIIKRFNFISTHHLFRNSTIYATANIIRLGIPFLLLPVLTRYLSPEDYGMVTTAQVLLNIAVVLVGLNCEGAISVNFFKLEPSQLKSYIGNVLIIIFRQFIIVLGCIFLIRNFLAPILQFPAQWLPLIVIGALGQSLILSRLIIWQMNEKPIRYCLLQFSQTASDLVLSLFFIITLGMKWEGRVLGILIPAFGVGLISLYRFYRNDAVTLQSDPALRKDILAYGIPLIPHTIGNLLLSGIDRIFLNNMVNTGATGLYTIGYQIGMFIGLLADSFNRAWSPFLFSRLTENNSNKKRTIVKFTYLYFLIITIISVALIFGSPWIVRLMTTKAYHGASQFVSWIAFAYAARGMTFMVSGYIFYSKKTSILAWLTFTAALINMAANYILIRQNGVIGAAQASFLTFFLSFLATWFFASRVYQMPWSLRK